MTFLMTISAQKSFIFHFPKELNAILYLMILSTFSRAGNILFQLGFVHILRNKWVVHKCQLNVRYLAYTSRDCKPKEGAEGG